MKNFTLTLLTLCLSFFATFSIAESPSTSPAPKVKKDRFEIFANRLKLNETQKKQLKPLLAQLKQERKETLEALNTKQKKALSGILNPEQTAQTQRMLAREGRMPKSMSRDSKKGKPRVPQKKYPIPPKKAQ